MLGMPMFLVRYVLSPLTICSITTVLQLFGRVRCHVTSGVLGLDTHSPFVVKLSRASQPLSGQCGSLMNMGVASYGYAAP